MRQVRGCWWVLLLGLLAMRGAGAGAVVAPARGGLDAIDACVRRLNSDVDVGYDRIISRCPALARQLNESGLAVWLPADWQRPGNDLSAGGLRELRELLIHELPVVAPVGARKPAVGAVPEILASLNQSDAQRMGWWGRTRAWLRNIFESQGAGADEGWLGRMVGESGVSQAVIELVSYLALAVVVVLAVGVVGNELRVSGVWGRLWGRFWRWRRVGRPGLPDGGGVVAAGELEWRLVLEAPVAERVSVLLDLVVARLNGLESVRLSRGLTARELVRVAPLADSQDRGRLAELARVSEWARFSGGPVSEAAVAEAVEQGRVLLQRLAGMAPGGVGP